MHVNHETMSQTEVQAYQLYCQRPTILVLGVLMHHANLTTFEDRTGKPKAYALRIEKLLGIKKTHNLLIQTFIKTQNA